MEPFHKNSPPATAAQLRWWLGPAGGGEADRLKKQGSLYEYPPGVVPPRVSPGFCVPKGASSFRLVVNAKHINIGCTALKCRYESLKLLQRMDLTHMCLQSKSICVMHIIRSQFRTHNDISSPLDSRVGTTT